MQGLFLHLTGQILPCFYFAIYREFSLNSFYIYCCLYGMHCFVLVYAIKMCVIIHRVQKVTSLVVYNYTSTNATRLTEDYHTVILQIRFSLICFCI